MVEAALDDFGFVDILVNNAGVASRGRTVADTDLEELERLVRVHALGAHQLARHVLPSMRTRPRGDIVMISSVATVALRRRTVRRTTWGRPRSRRSRSASPRRSATTAST